MVDINKNKGTEILKIPELFVLDMDGTFYLGEKLLDGAQHFLEAVSKRGQQFIFFTNNSSKTSEDYVKKLKHMGCFISSDKIITSGDVMIHYLKKNYKDKRVYLLGTKTLRENFRKQGIILSEREADIVVAGFDTTLTYQKLETACRFIRNGAVFLATHLDVNCPVEGGFIPDCGAICAAISLSCGVKPKYVGKPFKETIDFIVDKTGVPREKIAFVGDRIYTDTAAGVLNGALGFLVLTGETTLQDLEKSEMKPHAVFNSLKEMAGLL